MASGQRVTGCCKFFGRLFEYNTPLVLHTQSKTIGIIFRLLQLATLIIIFVYYIGYKRGYQLVSYDTTPATRIIRKDAYSALSQEAAARKTQYDEMNDEARMFYPTTAIKLTQKPSVCPEEPTMPSSYCNPRNRDPCPPLNETYAKNGDRTGNCVPVYPSKFSGHPELTHTCEIKGWCTQKEEIQEQLVERFKRQIVTVIIENELHFPRFPSQVNLNNHNGSATYCWANGHYYHPTFHPLCPLFKLGTIVEEASKAPGAIPFTLNELIRTGGLLYIQVMYDCNFDIIDPRKQCDISYQFRRLDVQFLNRTTVSRRPDYVFTNVMRPGIREVVHIYGINIFVKVAGVGRQLDFFTFLIRLGASAGLFAVASVFCELLLMFACCSTEKQTRDMKYVTSDDKTLVNL